jgi:hypothetical protein
VRRPAGPGAVQQRTKSLWQGASHAAEALVCSRVPLLLRLLRSDLEVDKELEGRTSGHAQLAQDQAGMS